MKIPLYQIDAFTDTIFGGNSAAVCPLEFWLDDDLLQKIALENNLAETVFFIKEKQEEGSKQDFHIRWFTPEIEMDLCGHATLAAAHVLFLHLGFEKNEVVFNSVSGLLKVSRIDDLLTLDFPARMPQPAKLPPIILEGVGLPPSEVWKARDYVLVYKTEAEILKITPNEVLLNTVNLDPGGIIVTAKGNEVDFVSRFFTPQASIFEDPVTGSAHCSLIPFWAKRLGKNKLTALQLSKRKGSLFCENQNDRVLISGKAVTYLKGQINFF